MNSRHRDDRFESSSFSELLARPFRIIGRSLGNLFGGNESIRENQSLFGRLVSLLTFPLRLLWAFILFMVQSWATSRSAPAFMFGLPSVIAIGLFLSGLWAANFTKETRSVGASQAYYEFHRENSPDKPERAEIFARKLVGLKPESDFNKFQLAELLFSSEKNDEALDIISYLAPEDRPGYPDAHVWLARYYMGGGDLRINKVENRERAVKHLEFALRQEPDNLNALSFLGKVFELDASKQEAGSPDHQESLQRSIDCFTKVVDFRTDNGERTIDTYAAVPDLIRVLDDAGRKEEAKQRLSYELKEMTRVARRAAEFNSDVYSIWLMLVIAAVNTDEFEQADEILDEGLQLARTKEDRDRILMLKSQVMVAEAGSFSDMQDRDDYRNRLKLLCEAVSVNPQNRTAYFKLLEFVATKSNPDFNENWLRDSVVDGEPGIVHVLLGIHEIDKGNVLEGQKHWRIAEQQFNLTQYVVSFVIDIAAGEYRGEFSNLPDMITLAIETFPDQPMLYQTRGVLFKQEGRYQEAVADFEQTAEKMPRLLSIRKHLVKCFEKLGQPEKAAEQEMILEEILGSLEIQERMRVEATLKKID